MELRAKSEPKYYSDAENSAHQFSVRSKSIQCDNVERKGIAAQTNIIDRTTSHQQVDIYDLMDIKDKSSQNLFQSFLPVRKDAACGTDLSRRMLASRDWFFSKLFRQLLR